MAFLVTYIYISVNIKICCNQIIRCPTRRMMANGGNLSPESKNCNGFGVY